MDPDIVLGDPSTLENFISEHVYAKPKFILISLVICATVGLVLSAIGIFSVMAYSVSLLTHEIGVRMALGAQRSAVLGMIFKKGAKLVGTGILIGFIGVAFVAPILSSQLFEVSSLDTLTVVTSSAVLLLAGLLACYAPALKATHVDTTTALRFE
jgi:putative ABC transport system permease protein